jgi:CDP-diacylglycerol--inositol 3-phosphatidyltransferase
MAKTISVYHYWPNRIDYMRFVLLIIGISVSDYSPITCLALIITSCLLDALDGYLARKLNQSSVLGSALDFAIDRMTLATIAILLIHVEPHYWLFWLFVLMLDSGSHFLHLYASLPQSHLNHKDMDATENKFLKQYYENKAILFTSCLVHDLFICVVYVYHYYPYKWILVLWVLFGIGFVHKTMIHVLQAISAIKKLARVSDAQTPSNVI